MAHELIDVAPGLWVWRIQHPDWAPEVDWEPLVTSTCVESDGEVAVLDALAPPEDATEIWERLDAKPPTLAVILKPDHIRDVDVFVRRYGARAYGPYLFWRHNIPETELEDRARERATGAWSRCTTGAAATRRPCGFPSNGRSCSPTR